MEDRTGAAMWFVYLVSGYWSGVYAPRKWKRREAWLAVAAWGCNAVGWYGVACFVTAWLVGVLVRERV